MTRPLFRPFVSLLAATFVFLTPILLPLAALGDRILTFGLTVFDTMFPLAEVAGHPGVLLRTTRDVTCLTTGLHRLAQKRSCLGDPDDEDEDDEIDNGLIGGATGTRLNC